jgi:DNA-binding beta-propeller fold protein YncE
MSRHHRTAHLLLGLALLAASLPIVGPTRAAPPGGPGAPAPAAAPVPPAPALPIPQWVGATDLHGRAQLTWIRSPAFAAVRVYRREIEAAPAFTLLAETRENSYVDATVEPGKSYRYRLAGVGPDGRVGRTSAELLVRIGTTTLRPPAPPEWEGYLAVEDGVGLKWSAREGEDVIAYNIYRKEPPETEARLVGSSRGTSYHDAGLVPGRLYVYTLTALDSAFGETAPSAELPVKFTPPQEAAETRRQAAVWRVRRTRLVALVTGGGDVPFGRPADVAVGPVSGSVYVSDSARGRVYAFSSQGVYQRMVGVGLGGAPSFKRVLGLATDGDENLYVVDAGTASVQVFSPQGRPGRRIDLPRPAGAGATGYIDAVAGPDGRVFAVDNFNNQVVVSSREGAPRPFGQAGGQAGEFSAPTFCATDAGGSFYVADCLNARVQVFSGAGEFVRAFGRAERGPGGFGRPKGVAVSAAGEIYVADSWLNTVQVFDPEGRFVAVLGDEAGRPLDLGSPNGVALGAGGRVYIAERLAARLQIREIMEP